MREHQEMEHLTLRNLPRGSSCRWSEPASIPAAVLPSIFALWRLSQARRWRGSDQPILPHYYATLEETGSIGRNHERCCAMRGPRLARTAVRSHAATALTASLGACLRYARSLVTVTCKQATQSAATRKAILRWISGC